MLPAAPGLVTDADAVVNPFGMTVNASTNVTLLVVSESSVFQSVVFLGFPTTPAVVYTGTGAGTLLTTPTGHDSASIPPSFLPYEMAVLFQFGPSASSLLHPGFINTPPTVQVSDNTTLITIISEDSAGGGNNADEVVAIISLFQN